MQSIPNSCFYAMRSDFASGGIPGPLVLILPVGYRLIIKQEQELQIVALLVQGLRFPDHDCSRFLWAGRVCDQADHNRSLICRLVLLRLAGRLLPGWLLLCLLIFCRRLICLQLVSDGGRRGFLRRSQRKIGYSLRRSKLRSGMHFIADRDFYLIVSGILWTGIPSPGIV